MALAPDIPTFARWVPGAFRVLLVRLFAPKHTPKDIIGKLNAAAVDALDEQRSISAR